MVFLSKCSSMNLWVSAISTWVRGKSCPSKVCCAPGRSSIAWSQMVCCGRHCDSSSLKTLPWHWYSSGTLGFGVDDAVGWWKVMRPMKYWFATVSLSTFLVRGVKTTLFACAEDNR